MIRSATENDIPILIEMGRQFADYVGGPVTYSPERVEALVKVLMDTGVVLVAEDSSGIKGVIMGAITPVWYATANVASEMALWIDPGQRGGLSALSLIRAFEAWGREQGAQMIVMSDLCIQGAFPAGGLFERAGYTVAERSHVKEVI